MNDTSLISVIIPTYNRAQLIKRSVESVLNQTYKNLELIIVDDGSIDNTKEIIDSLNDDRIIYIYQQNQGSSAARNTGINFAKGKYIAFQDSDDVWHPNKLEKQLNMLKQNNADVVFCKMYFFGNLIKRIRPEHLHKGFLEKKQLPLGVSPQAMLGKSEVFKNTMFNTQAQPIEDFEISLRIQKRYSIYCMEDVLVDYYPQTDSISNNSMQTQKAWHFILQSEKNFLNQYKETLKPIAPLILNEAFKIKDKKARKELISIAFKFNKHIKKHYFFHKIYFYKLKTLIYKTASTIIKFLLKKIPILKSLFKNKNLSI